eukprot:CAMPEP_0179024032 /NCGR_PEP_ID=MMETSP0796-20121207/7243_1 /TAXON_ID=73915 /ORGANISM="Pyrodinium bahamense, Strain pbaha01" /LENGTH=354 /DNA_ID=CAMNT_0020719975 /DNA_START=69 /DNA_END=1133 /DNA_ORIENTATION=+
MAEQQVDEAYQGPWPEWLHKDLGPIPDMEGCGDSLSAESFSEASLDELAAGAPVSKDKNRHLVPWHACKVRCGTVLVARRDVGVFESVSSWNLVGEAAAGSKVTACGVPEFIEGYAMVPIAAPRGAVQLNCFDVNVPQRSRRWRLRCALACRMARLPEPTASYDIHSSVHRRRTFIQIHSLLSEASIQELHELWRHPAVRMLQRKGRVACLTYRHTAYRMELPLRAHCRSLYESLVGTLLWADRTVWRGLKKGAVVYPEVEYLVYDARGGVPGTIEPHVDNESVVSAVVLLCDPAGFQGGASCFAPSGTDSAHHREVQLKLGDAVIFRGEKLEHWITPVTAGVRIVLQVELSRV